MEGIGQHLVEWDFRPARSSEDSSIFSEKEENKEAQEKLEKKEVPPEVVIKPSHRNRLKKYFFGKEKKRLAVDKNQKESNSESNIIFIFVGFTCVLVFLLVFPLDKVKTDYEVNVEQFTSEVSIKDMTKQAKFYDKQRKKLRKNVPPVEILIKLENLFVKKNTSYVDTIKHLKHYVPQKINSFGGFEHQITCSGEILAFTLSSLFCIQNNGACCQVPDPSKLRKKKDYRKRLLVFWFMEIQPLNGLCYYCYDGPAIWKPSNDLFPGKPNELDDTKALNWLTKNHFTLEQLEKNMSLLFQV